MRAWLRNYFRKKMHFMDPEVAQSYKTTLSLIYAGLAWNILGLTIYFAFKEKAPKLENSIDYVKLLGVKNATVIKYSGFHKVEEQEVELTEEDFQQFYSGIGDSAKKKQKELEKNKELEEENISTK